MGKLVVTEFVSIDGIFQDPGGAEGYEHGGWTFEYNRGDDGDKFKLDELLEADAHLLGRVTYEGFAAAWPQRDGEFADRLNNDPKYVVSTTLTNPTWNNTTVIADNVPEQIAKLVAHTGGTVLVAGSGTLVATLLEHDLVDELRLMVFPTILGRGRRLFPGWPRRGPSALTAYRCRSTPRRHDEESRLGGRMPVSLEGQAVVVLGGTSGIGLATATMAKAQGADVTVVGRDAARLADALALLGDGASGATLDVADEAAVRDFFAGFDHIDHVAMLAGTHANGEIVDTDTSTLREPVENRLWGALYVCKYAAPKMTDGSITICTGAGVARPRKGAAIVAAAAGASEFIAKAVALEVAPVRVNIIRPGIVDTPLMTRMAGDHRDAMLEAMAKRIPLGRVAQPADIADAILFLMGNTYMTGSTLTIDGGFGLI
jgi:NAD(P)-dependent dehydrogenase (short-subunit alcohol dehydrogenase family)/dihydrofolate reductase